jgi:ribosome biogenesis GTPase
MLAAISHPVEAARVVGVDRGLCRLATASGRRTLPFHDVAVGDWLALTKVSKDGPLDRGAGVAGPVRHEVLPRWSRLERIGHGGVVQVMAANVDVVCVVAPGDRLSLPRVEREIAIAWDSGARPVVVLTKLDRTAPETVSELTGRLGGVACVLSSSVTGDGLDELRRLLVAPLTAVLLGPSGAGKSTLVNALLGEDRLAVGAVRDDGRGRHTTSARRLVPLPSGGCLIDMPGVRSLVAATTAGAVAQAFPDVERIAEGCRFGDCAHESEPDCAVLAAVDAGELDPARLASFRRLSSEIVPAERRGRPRGHPGGTTPG